MTLTEFHDVKPVIISAVTIMNITLNSIVIAVIAKYPQLREDRTTLFMFSLTLSDFAAGCTCMPISAALCSNATPLVQNMLQYLPRIQAICLTLFSLNSIHSLCWMTVCKLVAILKPFHYEQLLTRNRCYAIIAAIWIFAAAYSIAAKRFIVSWDLETCIFQQSAASEMTAMLTIGLIFGILLPVLVIVYATARILSAIVRIHYEISTQVHSIGGSGSVVGANSSLTLQSIRSGKNLLLMCGGLLLLTIPGTIYAIAVTLGTENQLPSWFKFGAVWILMCNSSVNSLLYLALFRSVRKKTSEMFAAYYKLCCFL